MSNKAECMDCKKLYEEFGMDMLFPRGQWLEINPDDDGLLCCQCMINRACKIPGAIVVHSVIEIKPAATGSGKCI
jgi:hypothetical protein